MPVIDDLIALGHQFLDPIQTNADGKDPESLFAQFGDRLFLH